MNVERRTQIKIRQIIDELDEQNVILQKMIKQAENVEKKTNSFDFNITKLQVAKKKSTK